MNSESTLQPFGPGDVFAGATLLNDPDDDHAGRGRIIQYDAGLNEKAYSGSMTALTSWEG